MKLPGVDDVERLLGRLEQRADSPARGRGTAARVGTALGVAFTICFLTGMWSHLQYSSPSWAPIGPSPTQLYRVTQGLHVATGIVCVPLVLVKLWSVYPRLFQVPPRPGRALVLHGLERLSIGVLVGSAIFQLTSGMLNIVQWYPWEFSFRATHEAVAWVAIGSILLHVAVKLPDIRAGYAERGPDPGPDDVSRRTVLTVTGLSTAAAAVLTLGQTVPFLRKVSVFAVRDGYGPQGLPINRTARAAGIPADHVRSYALEVVGPTRTVRLTLDDLAAMPQRTHRLPIACVEGWSASAVWTGVAIADLVALVDGSGDVRVRSAQTRGAFGSSTLPADFADDAQSLLALQLNGQPLALDHGAPARVIAPNRPGVLQTKWVTSLEVGA